MKQERPRPIDAGRLIELIDRFEGVRVAVFGDLIVDEFIYGEIGRVSREAPVLILNYDSTEILPGGAGNAASNVAALGGVPDIVGLVGRDDTGDRLMAALESRGRTSGIIRPRDYRTPTKTRILAGGVHSAKQQVVRIDRAAATGSGAAHVEAIAPKLARAVAASQAVLVSDYGTGLAAPKVLAASLQPLQRKGLRQRGSDPLRGLTPWLVDSRYSLLKFRGMTTCTPNESEVEQLLGVRIGENTRVLERSGRELLTRTRAESVLITRGSRGMALFERDQPTVHIPIYGSDQIADVTGAGDTVIATMTLALASGARFEEAARLANYAGGLVVMKRGTATITAEELRIAVLSDIA